MSISILRFSPCDAAYAAVAAIAAGAGADALCDFEYTTGAELQAFDEGFARAGHAVRRHVAECGGEVVGYAYSFPVTWELGTGRHWIMARVAHGHRRQGVGRALLERALADVRAAGGRAALTMARESHGWTASALARRGFHELLRSWEYTLDPRACDTAALRRYLARAEAAGITLTTLAAERERNPAWLPQLFALHAALNAEIPIPEHPNMTPEWFAGFAQALPEAFFIARDGERYVGESFMHRAASNPATLVQKTTGVLPAWRGRGVATALKLLTVDFARRAGYARISTWIESNNPSMLAVSERLGFVRGPGQIVFERQPA
ncbi:MAG TPA: GNAT family N-acetyltransferase [Roseiflexaceae bacterium]|nr:GNAT family N-acetyltransferase [Roseiflexaceae bacterium]